MPGFLASSDRKLLAGAGAVMLVLMVLISYASPQTAQRGSTTPSTYATDSGGALAAFRLLKDLHRNVTRFEQSPTELPADSSNAMLIIANPIQKPSESEQDALRQFVENGARLLLPGTDTGNFISSAHVVEAQESNEAQLFRPNFPSEFTRGAEKIEMEREAEWTRLSGPQNVVYGDTDQPAVVTWRIGKGRVLWWAGATPLRNGEISRERNMEFFLDAVSNPKAAPNEQPNIYWDEYFHGERGSLWGYVAKTPLPWGILQIGVIGLALFFTFGRRSGPISVPLPVSRRSPLEFVDTLAGLYQRAHAESAMVGIVLQRLRTSLTRQLRLPANTSDAALGQAVAQRLGVNGADFVRALQRASAAHPESNTSPAAALAIVQELEAYEEQFGLKRKRLQEKM